MNKQPRSNDEVRKAEVAADRRSKVPQKPHDPDDNDRWMAEAVCRDEDPELFHPASGDAKTLPDAVKVCNRCPVHAACRALRYDTGATGVWGGVYYGPSSRGQRPCVTKDCRKPAQGTRTAYCSFEHEHAAKVGTQAGYDAHRKYGNDPCDACKTGRYNAMLKYDRPGPAARGAGGARAYQGPPPGRRVMA